MQWCNWRGVVSDRIYCRPALPTQGTGWDVFVDVSPKGPDVFSCHALDLPFTDKGTQACRLKGSTTALGQSLVCRHTQAIAAVVVVVVCTIPTREVNISSLVFLNGREERRDTIIKGCNTRELDNHLCRLL